MSYLFPELEQKTLAKRIPTDVSFELTHRCNLACPICYVSPCPQELTSNEVKIILDELARAGCLFLTFTGGEPLLRKDIWEILDYATTHGFAVTLKTNGTLLDKHSAKIIKKTGVMTVQISLLGGNPDVHDTLTGVKGSFDSSLSAIGWLKEAGIKVQIMSVITGGHLQEIKNIQKIAEEIGLGENGVTFDSVIFPRNDRGKTPLKYRLSDSELRDFFQYLKIDPVENADLDTSALLTEENVNDDLSLTCGAARNGIAVTPDGTVFPCLSLPIPLGNLLQESMKDILHSQRAENLIDLIRLGSNHICRACPDKIGCFRCPGLSYLENGDAQTVPQEGCRQTKIKKEVLNGSKTERSKEKETLYHSHH